MYGWNAYLLNVDLGNRKIFREPYDKDFALGYLGGRGFAAKILWDRLEKGVDPLSPENLLILATGPLTGLALPNSGKLVVASKSPLTGGYGDGNIGTFAAVHLRKTGHDALVVTGKADSPVILHVKNENVEFLDGSDYWGLDSFETEARLRRIFGKATGIVSIGQGGENLVKFACVVSQEGRAGGRPGIGAVMGSKNLKAIVFEGSKDIPIAKPQELRESGISGFRAVLEQPKYDFWKRQGTLSTLEWGQENSVLPSYNYREGLFEDSENIGGFAAEEMKVSNRGCPNCNMTCGNVVLDAENKEVELDYENLAMLGSNIGLGNLKQVSVLNRLADEYGLDTISLGNVIGFAMEASEKGLIKESFSWGSFQDAKDLTEKIVYRKGIGNVLATGVKVAADKIGGGSSDWSMHVKGLEISAYDCHTAPAMALAYGTSPIGAHHKDAWVLGWEIMNDRESYSEEKAKYVFDTQNTRGVFEGLGTCRFPVINLGLEFDWYLKFLSSATGMDISWEMLEGISVRTFNLIRAFWVREYSDTWSRQMDYPPLRWFEEPLRQGSFEGSSLDRARYDKLLSYYYSYRGWDDRGIPKASTLNNLGLNDIAEKLSRHVKLTA